MSLRKARTAGNLPPVRKQHHPATPRMSFNVLGASVTQTGDPAPEFSAAFALLERGIHRISGGLKEISVRERSNTRSRIAAEPAQCSAPASWGRRCSNGIRGLL